MPGYRNERKLRADDDVAVMAGEEMLGTIRVMDILP